MKQILPLFALLLLLSGCYSPYMYFTSTPYTEGITDNRSSDSVAFQDSTVIVTLGIPHFSEIKGYQCNVDIGFGEKASNYSDSIYVQDVQLWFTNRKGKVIEVATNFEVYTPKINRNSHYYSVQSMPDNNRGSAKLPNKLDSFDFGFDCSDFGYYRDIVVHCAVKIYLNGKPLSCTLTQSARRETKWAWLYYDI